MRTLAFSPKSTCVSCRQQRYVGSKSYLQQNPPVSWATRYKKWFVLCYGTAVLSVLSVSLCGTLVLYCGQTAQRIKMPLCMEVPHCVRRRLSSPHEKEHSSPRPLVGPCLLWPNGWMDQDTTWYRGRPRPRQHCLWWRPSSPTEKGIAAPQIYGMVTHLSNCWALVFRHW